MTVVAGLEECNEAHKIIRRSWDETGGRRIIGYELDCDCGRGQAGAEHPTIALYNYSLCCPGSPETDTNGLSMPHAQGVLG